MEHGYMTKKEFKQELNDFLATDFLIKDDDGYPDYNEIYIVRLASYGDYDNSCAVERANFRDLKENFEKLPFVLEGYGGYSSEWIYIDIKILNDTRWTQKISELSDELIEVFKGLMDYPAINDETVSEIEMELQNDAWENCYESDFISALADKFPGHYLNDLDYSSEKLREVFEQVRENISEYWIIESGGNAYIDLEKIKQAIEPENLKGIFYLDFEPETFNDLSLEQLREAIEYIDNAPFYSDRLEKIKGDLEYFLNMEEKSQLNLLTGNKG